MILNTVNTPRLKVTHWVTRRRMLNACQWSKACSSWREGFEPPSSTCPKPTNPEPVCTSRALTIVDVETTI